MSQRVESSHWYFQCYFFWNAVGLWPRLDYQPLFGKMSPHSSPSSGRIKDRTRETVEIEPNFGPLPEHKKESTRFKEFWRRDYYCLHIHVRSSSERNHLLAQMIWRNNFSEKKSFFFRFNQNCKILISCPFFTISNGQTDFTFYTQKRIFLENWLTCIRICPVGNKMHVLSR